MKFKDAVLSMLKYNNKSQRWLAEEMGISAPGVGQMLARENATLNSLVKVCEILDYEVTIQPKRKSGARPQGQIVLEGNNKERKKKEYPDTDFSGKDLASEIDK